MPSSRTRWFLYELLKLFIAVNVILWIRSQDLVTKQEVFASTGRLLETQGDQVNRISSLEKGQTSVGTELRRSLENEVAAVRSKLSERDAKLADERANIVKLIDDRTGELKSYIEKGIGRVEGTTHTAYSRSVSVDEKLQDLERRLKRRPSAMLQHMVFPIVQLRGNGTVGSGVVIHSERDPQSGKVQTYVLTAYHVITEVMGGVPGSESTAEMRFLDTNTHCLQDPPRQAHLVASDEGADVALLSVDLEEPWPYCAKLATSNEMDKVSVFDRVYAVGCPLGNKPMPTVGEVSSQEKIVSGHNFWMVSAPTFFGNSGGGIFLADSAELIGISSMIYTYGKSQPMVVPHMGLFVPLQTIRDWMGGEGYSFLLVNKGKRAAIKAVKADLQE